MKNGDSNQPKCINVQKFEAFLKRKEDENWGEKEAPQRNNISNFFDFK